MHVYTVLDKNRQNPTCAIFSFCTDNMYIINIAMGCAGKNTIHTCEDRNKLLHKPKPT